ncbi:MAG: polysaccharide biosynthesis/export family protein [Verrucomicrobiota bacterium]
MKPKLSPFLHAFLLLLLTSVVLNLSAAEPNVSATQPQKTFDRKVAPQDVLMIMVFGEPELSLEQQVQASGTIQYPFLNSIQVADKTCDEIAELIKSQLKDGYLVDPQITVQVKAYARKTVLVTGQVNKPGSVELPPEQKWGILEAIAAAGDLTRLAKGGKIEFTRKGKTQYLDVEDLKKVTDPQKRITLEPDDIIFVPERVF